MWSMSYVRLCYRQDCSQCWKSCRRLRILFLGHFHRWPVQVILFIEEMLKYKNIFVKLQGWFSQPPLRNYFLTFQSKKISLGQNLLFSNFFKFYTFIFNYRHEPLGCLFAQGQLQHSRRRLVSLRWRKSGPGVEPTLLCFFLALCCIGCKIFSLPSDCCRFAWTQTLPLISEHLSWCFTVVIKLGFDADIPILYLLRF